MADRPPIIQEELPSVIRLLRQPAGDDPLFATVERIHQHRAEFLPRVHSTWKKIHNRSLEELLKIEALLQSPNIDKLHPDLSWFLRYCMAIWRRVNDALVWSVFGLEGHYVRRFCHRRTRPVLSQANPAAIRQLLDDLNSDPLTFALWADATSCVDVGDVISRSFSGKPSGIFEVKEGKINEKIFDLITSGGDIETKIQQIEAFAQAHGEKAIKQLDRVARQIHVLTSVGKILEMDRGFDPYWQRYVLIRESRTRDQSYDNSLAALIKSSAGAPVLECIDECLWVYIDRDPDKTLSDRIRAFSAALFQRSPAIREWNKDRYGSDTLEGIVPLDANLFEPIAVPLFLRPFDPETVRDILLGSLKERILLYFDWIEYSRIIEGLGATLTWSSRKAGRAQHSLPHHQRVMTVGERIPVVSLPDGRSIQGHSRVYRVLFEGILPSIVAGQYIEMLHTRPSLGKEEDAT